MSSDMPYPELYRLTPPGSPRYSMAPPPYEKVEEAPPPVETNLLSNTISTFWKRASFSLGDTANQDIKESLSNTSAIDKKQVEHALTLINIATEMSNGGNQQMAIDIYMIALDKMISALPLESDPSVRVTLEQKLSDIREHHQLDIASLQNLFGKKSEGNSEPYVDSFRSQVSEFFVSAAVQSAIALKKSPIPDTISSVMNNTIDLIQVVDQSYKVRQRTWDLASSSITKAIYIDRQYGIHQMITGAVYTGVTAFVKAGMAYAETPSRS
ncbi:hypothetical protein K501DRAFT_244641 [Backusella circina FSU 941]|nr:hypothetical protein K501DRAFT_244641 [Backusella circina FSU 941]